MSRTNLDGLNDILNGETTKGGSQELPQVLCITTYPPRQCGIATFSQDLVSALEEKFDRSFTMRICPIISANGDGDGLKKDKRDPFIDLRDPLTFVGLLEYIVNSPNITMVLIQHEFGLFRDNESGFMTFLAKLQIPLLVTFHTVLPGPGERMRKQVKKISVLAKCLVVMTRSSAEILETDYSVKPGKIVVIPHGTHLVLHKNKKILKKRYAVEGRTVLSTFGLLGPGKSIETTLRALPAIIAKIPGVLFLVIGKTHPGLIKEEGECYRDRLKDMISELGLGGHVRFVDAFLDLPVLLDYLQLSDIYLFTSKDPNQAVSGTFSYAVSCGCPIVSTPIPHAKEALKDGMGILMDFESPQQLSGAVIRLLGDAPLRRAISKNEILASAPTSWENVAIAHANLFRKLGRGNLKLRYSLPPICLSHLKKLTTSFGMVQFCEINVPDLGSGYTLDDNARALITMGEHYRLTRDPADLGYIELYFGFIAHCHRSDEGFLNYVDGAKNFTVQNKQVNLEDSNGRAIWALGHLISLNKILPTAFDKTIALAVDMVKRSRDRVRQFHSTRAMAFVIKGLYYKGLANPSDRDREICIELADRLVNMYRHESKGEWNWFEGYLTYGNSILPEALLCAWEITGNIDYRAIAKESFDFLLSRIISGSSIRVISNQGWLYREKMHKKVLPGGEQPIDVAYTIMALDRFHGIFPNEGYFDQLTGAFNWFLGDNHLNQIIYNPCTGGCYDGLEAHNVNLNQGAESTLSYLLSRFVLERGNHRAIADRAPSTLEDSKILY